MKLRKKLIPFLVLTACLVLFCSMPVFAAELTEADVEAAVASQGKEAVTGNVFVWFLCAIAFLKVSQKIDSFLASLGINVGNTGGNMMAELLIAGRSLTGSMRSHGGGGYHKASSPGSAAVAGSFLSGGLAGAVGRQVQREAVNSATGYTEHSSIGNMLYQSSLNKGGDFANQVISNIAQGNYGQVGSIKGADAQKAFTSYMGINPGGGMLNDGFHLYSLACPCSKEDYHHRYRNRKLRKPGFCPVPCRPVCSSYSGLLLYGTVRGWFHLVQAVCTGYGRKNTIYFRQRQSSLQ